VLRPRMAQIIVRHASEPAPEVCERIDAVLVSHLHHDHLDFPSLRRVGTEVPVIAPAGGGRVIARRGFREVTELAAGESLAVGAMDVTATRAVHDGRRLKLGPRVEALGYVLTTPQRRIYFAGDTDLFRGMGELAGDLDVALLPIGGWGPNVGRGHLDARKAAEAAAMLRPRLVVPIHWGTFLRLGLGRHAEKLLREPGRRFAAQLAERAPEVDVAVLEPGESLSLDSPSR
jgi:L-ascorbate metabolism protein UlaG (beta-lactamase superfamily)